MEPALHVYIRDVWPCARLFAAPLSLASCGMFLSFLLFSWFCSFVLLRCCLLPFGIRCSLPRAGPWAGMWAGLAAGPGCVFVFAFSRYSYPLRSAAGFKRPLFQLLAATDHRSPGRRPRPAGSYQRPEQLQQAGSS